MTETFTQLAISLRYLADRHVWRFEFGSLEFVWNLVLAIWNFYNRLNEYTIVTHINRAMLRAPLQAAIYIPLRLRLIFPILFNRKMILRIFFSSKPVLA